MISFEKEDAKHFLRHLASATRKTQEREILKQKLTGRLSIGLATKPIEEKIIELESKLGKLEKIEKTFDALKEKVSDYKDIKKEEEKALEEIRKPSRVDRRGIRSRLKSLERKYNALKKKGYSKASLKRIKNRIDRSKKVLNSLKS